MGWWGILFCTPKTKTAPSHRSELSPVWNAAGLRRCAPLYPWQWTNPKRTKKKGPPQCNVHVPNFCTLENPPSWYKWSKQLEDFTTQGLNSVVSSYETKGKQKGRSPKNSNGNDDSRLQPSATCWGRAINISGHCRDVHMDHTRNGQPPDSVVPLLIIGCSLPSFDEIRSWKSSNLALMAWTRCVWFFNAWSWSAPKHRESIRKPNGGGIVSFRTQPGWPCLSGDALLLESDAWKACDTVGSTLWPTTVSWWIPMFHQQDHQLWWWMHDRKWPTIRSPRRETVHIRWTPLGTPSIYPSTSLEPPWHPLGRSWMRASHGSRVTSWANDVVMLRSSSLWKDG